MEIILTHHVLSKLALAFISEHQIGACVLDADAVESARLSGFPRTGLRLQRDFAQGTLVAIVRQSGEQIIVITAWWSKGDPRGKPREGGGEASMTIYNAHMAFAVEYEAEGGLHIIHLGEGHIVGGRDLRDREGVSCGVVHVDAEGTAIDIEIFSLPHFDLDDCAAEYGFSDRAGAIGMALATAAG